MQNIKLHSRVGSDGILHLEVPIEITDSEIEITIIVKPVYSQTETTKKSNWSPRFFKQTAGAWEGGQLKREPQGEYESREELF
jgi:hypothetical protein